MGVTSTYEAYITATVRIRLDVEADTLGEATDRASDQARGLLGSLDLPTGVSVETVSPPTDVRLTRRGIPEDESTFLGFDTAGVARFISSPALNEDDSDLGAIATSVGLPAEAGPVIADTSGLLTYTGDSWRWRFTQAGRDFYDRYGVQ